VWGYAALLAGVYVTVMIGVVLGCIPATLLLACLTAPLAYKGVRGVQQFYDEPSKLIPTSAATALLMCVGYVIAKFV
jgi:1,4-dihydroxy-2-naphthoate octaprenyltransferase